MKYIKIDNKLINLEHVISFSRGSGGYSSGPKCTVKYADGSSENIDMSDGQFDAIIKRLDNFNLLI